jgi:UDP-N-acetylglucosamine 4,6-dehydratase
VARYLILGATGTLGRAMTKELLNNKFTESITCLSRDELKQVELKRDFPDKRVKTVIGDIRDKHSISAHFRNIDAVFHFAALKRIPEMEAHPLECLKTNVLGTVNAADCALEHGVKDFVFSSTDKAARPINTYGACKFLSEQILLNYNLRGETRFSVYRWGNVLNSRGAILSAFNDSVKNDQPAHLTHKDMSRFWIKIEDAVKFILSSYGVGDLQNVKFPQMKAAKVIDFLDAIGRVRGKKAKHEVVGMRPGEKIAEDIWFNPETGYCLSSDNAPRFSKAELDELAREFL